MLLASLMTKNAYNVNLSTDILMYLHPAYQFIKAFTLNALVCTTILCGTGTLEFVTVY
jgi:hypothetical protein